MMMVFRPDQNRLLWPYYAQIRSRLLHLGVSDTFHRKTRHRVGGLAREHRRKASYCVNCILVEFLKCVCSQQQGGRTL